MGFVWAGFILLVLLILAFDLGLFSQSTKTLTARTALFRTGVYFLLAVCFTAFVYFAYQNHWFGLGILAPGADPSLPDTGVEAALLFFGGYLLEQSLSVDNIFVIALILGYFKVPAPYQHRVLLWGILGALVMRGVMIGAGVALIQYFEFMTYIFGGFLILTAAKMLWSGEDDDVNFDNALLIRFVRRFFRFHPDFVGDHFLTRIDGKLAITPLLLALVVVETTDLVFAVDSIPAVIGLTSDPFLVFTSNVFAILGLRSLYFALADLLGRFHLLKYSLVVILAFVGAKMLLEKPLIAHFATPHTAKQVEGDEEEKHVDANTKAEMDHHALKGMINLISFAVIVIALSTGVAASFIIPEKHAKDSTEKSEPPADRPAV